MPQTVELARLDAQPFREEQRETAPTLELTLDGELNPLTGEVAPGDAFPVPDSSRVPLTKHVRRS